MSTHTEEFEITVTEEVQYSRTIRVTAELLAEAASEGFEQSAEGVMLMLEAHPEHDEVLGTVNDSHFSGVFDREVMVG